MILKSLLTYPAYTLLTNTLLTAAAQICVFTIFIYSKLTLSYIYSTKGRGSSHTGSGRGRGAGGNGRGRPVSSTPRGGGAI